MSLIRVLVSSAATLTREFYVDEDLTDAAAGPTITIKRLDGTVLVNAAAFTTHPKVGTYTYAWAGSAVLDFLVVTWVATVGGAVMTFTDYIEVVGGFYFGLAEGRASDSSLKDPVKYPESKLASTRIEVEQEAELICGQAFVPRFARLIRNGRGTTVLTVPDPWVRKVRAASQAWVTGGVQSALDVTRIVPTDEGTLVRGPGQVWPFGTGNVTVEYEHGLPVPFADVRRVALLRFRILLTQPGSGVPAQATSYTTQEGTTFRVAPSGQKETGIPEVDAVYRKHPPPLGDFA